MTKRSDVFPGPQSAGLRVVLLAMCLSGALAASQGWARGFTEVTPSQLQTARQVAEQGVPLADLAPDAPSSHTVRRGDTLWDLSKLFLKSPWRWAELWGMNLQQVRNPHLIYPGQVLVLVKGAERATLQLLSPKAAESPFPTDLVTVRQQPKVRSEPLPSGAIASVPMQLISAFLTESAVLSAGDIDDAPRIVAARNGQTLMTKGEIAYVQGDLQGRRLFQLVRQPRALRDPLTREILGYEARLVGAAEVVGDDDAAPAAPDKPQAALARVLLKEARLEIGAGDRLTQAPEAAFAPFVPRSPERPVDGQVISLYGEGLMASQNRIVSLNRGALDGIERGHVLALWSTGTRVADPGHPTRQKLRLPDERNGQMFVFRVFDRVSYALILNNQDPVSPGARFSQP